MCARFTWKTFQYLFVGHSTRRIFCVRLLHYVINAYIVYSHVSPVCLRLRRKSHRLRFRVIEHKVRLIKTLIIEYSHYRPSRFATR